MKIQISIPDFVYDSIRNSTEGKGIIEYNAKALYNAIYYAKPITEPERKNGRWVKAKGSWCTPGGDPVWECSECGKGVHVYGIEHGTYGADIADGQWVACPNCGAIMESTVW